MIIQKSTVIPPSSMVFSFFFWEEGVKLTGELPKFRNNYIAVEINQFDNVDKSLLLKVKKEDVKNTSLVIVVTSLGVFGREADEVLLKILMTTKESITENHLVGF